MDYKIILPVLLSFTLSVIMGPVVIPILRKLKMKQTEREDGVKSHLKKAGTPNMGGVIILTSIVVTSMFFIKDFETFSKEQTFISSHKLLTLKSHFSFVNTINEFIGKFGKKLFKASI